MNTKVFERQPDTYMIAEESTGQANVTKPIEAGGLGFNYKWNMGWMNDTLRFFEMDPLFRKDNFNLITFSFMYAFTRTLYCLFLMMKWSTGNNPFWPKCRETAISNLRAYGRCKPI